MREPAALAVLENDPDMRLICSKCGKRTGGRLDLWYLFELDESPNAGQFELRRSADGFEQRLRPAAIDYRSKEVPLAELVRMTGIPPQWNLFKGRTIICVGCRFDGEIRRFDLLSGQEA